MTSRRPNDDLFEGTTMTFGEHLEELRRALYRAIIGLVLGTLVALLIAHLIVQAIQGPLKRALDRYYLTKATEELTAQYGEGVPPEMLALIQEEGLVPSSIRLEAAALLASLKAAAPGQFGDLQVTPHRFHAADLRAGSAAKLCARWKEEGSGDRPTPGKLLWQLLSDQQRRDVQRIAARKAADTQDRERVVAILNDLLDQPSIPTSAEFSHVDGGRHRRLGPLSPTTWLNRLVRDTDELQASSIRTVANLRHRVQDAEGNSRPVDPDTLRRLNKLLIASAYGEMIRPPRPLLVEVPTWKPTDVRVQTLNAQEAFMIWLKAALICGFVISSPWIFWQIWAFVAAGLYPHEKRYVYIYLPFSLLLFLAGTALAFFFVFEPVLNFLFSFNKLMGMEIFPRITEWLSFVLFLPLGFGIAFQLPLVMLFLSRIGVFSIQAYLEKWRIAILVIFVLSMLLTPADPISMLLMAFPLTALYFLGIALCKWMPRGRSPFAEAYEP